MELYGTLRINSALNILEYNVADSSANIVRDNKLSEILICTPKSGMIPPARELQYYMSKGEHRTVLVVRPSKSICNAPLADSSVSITCNNKFDGQD